MKKEPLKIAVIGGGSWATAIIKILSDNFELKELYWWMRNEKQVNHIQKYGHNPNYLSSTDVHVASNNISNDLKLIIKEVDVIILSIPAAFLKETLEALNKEHFKNKIVVSAIKGIVPGENQLVGEYLQSTFQINLDKIVVLSGPCHAEEVSQEKLSYLTLASAEKKSAEIVSSIVRNRYIKTVISADVYGTEYGAVLKNIYAVASGICHGIGLGDNFQAVLISNALREMARFVDVASPIERDIKESAYLGDLLVTAYSQFSRNRTFGNMIGRGHTVKSAQLEMNMVAEGYFASRSIHQINKIHKVDIPICRAVYAILYEKHSPIMEMKLLSDLLS